LMGKQKANFVRLLVRKTYILPNSSGKTPGTPLDPSDSCKKWRRLSRPGI
jgi:hypothetical protein